MTVEAMSGLSMQAGSAVAAAAGRAALWAVSAYMQQPLRNTAIAALIGLSAMAGSNALYHQAHHHPAPLFGSFSAAPAAAPAKTRKAPAPVMPAQRPRQLEGVDNPETTGSVDPSVSLPKLLGNADVSAVQKQLTALTLYDGAVDGMYGPRTIKAIKAFEAKLGRPVKGQLTPDIVALITSTQALPGPVVQQGTAPITPAPVPMQVAPLTPAPLVAEKPLPAPAPLLKSNAQPADDAPVADTQADDAQVADISPANDVPAAQTLPLTKANAVPKRQVQTIAVRVQQPAPEQAMPATIAPDADVPPATDGEDA